MWLLDGVRFNLDDVTCVSPSDQLMQGDPDTSCIRVTLMLITGCIGELTHSCCQ